MANLLEGPGKVSAYASGNSIIANSSSVVVAEDPALGAINNLPPGVYMICFCGSNGAYTGGVQVTVTPSLVSTGQHAWLFDFMVGSVFLNTTLTGVGLVVTTGTKSVSIGNASGQTYEAAWSIVRLL